MRLRPDPVITADDLKAGEHRLVMDSAWASLTGAFSGGVILVAFALALGANPMQIGLLAAIPFIAQIVQFPATLLIERVRQRRRIGVIAITAARVLILLLAVLPWLGNASTALSLLIYAQVLISLLNSTGGCAVNSWLHQLVPRAELGSFFARRLIWGTTFSCIGTLLAGLLIQYLPSADKLTAFALAFALAGVSGFVSSYYLARAPEPEMLNLEQDEPLRARLLRPFRDPMFRRLLIFLAAWNVASNLAAPFLSVYLLRQLYLPISTVTALWVVSQIANALTIYLWGRLSDRLTNKAILATALPTFFLATFALVFSDAIGDARWRLDMLFLLHVIMGMASGGIGLAAGNLGMKLAPMGQGTSYLAAVGLVSAIAGGVAPLVAGVLAHAFEQVQLSALIRWVSTAQTREFTVLQFSHWEFLFGLSALLGLYVMHALSRLKEGEEIAERIVVQEFLYEALRAVDNLSSVAGSLGNLFAFDRLFEKPAWWRGHPRR